jgi:hypothetical protein
MERHARLSQWTLVRRFARPRVIRGHAARVRPLRSVAVNPRLNETQHAVLRWLADGQADGAATNPQRLTARALSNRRLVKIKGRGPRWHAELTEAGRHYVLHGEYPPGHFGPEPAPAQKRADVAEPAAAAKVAGRPKAKQQAEPAVDLTVDSPAGKRRSGGRPLGDALFTASRTDPYDEKVLVTVKEAAWMLSLPEHAIRQAVSLGDLDRVFVGEGGKNYRIVYGSLLAWVNSMPRESARTSWWR